LRNLILILTLDLIRGAVTSTFREFPRRRNDL